MFRVASFFTGVGGIDLAFSKAGFDIVLQCEIDTYCQKVLLKNKSRYWPNARLVGDIRTIESGFIDEFRPVDVMCAGFPCQDISKVGLRTGVMAGTRSGLVFDFLRTVSTIRPIVVLLENVANVRKVGGVEILAELARIGYSSVWFNLCADVVGAPHKRERWFCLSVADGNSFDQERGTKFDRFTRVQPEPTNKLVSGSDNLDRTARDGIKYTLPESTMGGKVYGVSPYLANVFPAGKGAYQKPQEALRLHNTITPARKNQIHALGNAVVPQQVYPIALAIRNYLTIQKDLKCQH